MHKRKIVESLESYFTNVIFFCKSCNFPYFEKLFHQVYPCNLTVLAKINFNYSRNNCFDNHLQKYIVFPFVVLWNIIEPSLFWIQLFFNTRIQKPLFVTYGFRRIRPRNPSVLYRKLDQCFVKSLFLNRADNKVNLKP